MPKVVVGFWKCTMHHGWRQFTLTERLRKIRTAMFSVDVEGRMRSTGLANSIHSILVSPEYTFSADTAAAYPLQARQTDAAGFKQVLEALKAESRARPQLLMIPGSIAHAKYDDAMNTCIAVLGGRVRSVFHKNSDVGETADDDGLTFKPGVGSGSFTENGTTFLLQICRDAFLGMAQVVNPEVQIVVSQGMNAAIPRLSTRTLIVADTGDCYIVDIATGRLAKPYREDEVDGISLYYYLVDI